ncbi:choice-of-anchor D domain-containing protein, partial [Thermodesulfovibrionales bacterium]|nr:choice-of-anchor D domain-containing protein [Thermodesulfovibrionales bacterium]
MFRKLFFALGVLAVFSMTVFAPAAYGQTLLWEQVNEDGFRPANNKFVIPAVEFGPPGATYLYTGTFSGIGGEIWRSPDGTTWTEVPTDFGADNLVVIPMAIFGGYLYAGTGNEVAGGEIWRSSDGLTWTRVMTGGFRDSNNASVFPWAVFGGHLYAKTSNWTTGAEIWRSSDGTTWTEVLSPAINPGFTSANGEIFGMIEFGGHLYVGTDNATGGQIWRSSDGITWIQADGGVFGSANTEVTPWAVFGGHLYAGTSNWMTGAELWRWDGTTWTKVLSPAINLDFTSANGEIFGMVEFGVPSHLYIGTFNPMGGEVWRSSDGLTWTLVPGGGGGIGDANNKGVIPVTVFGGNLYAGTDNYITGGQIWRWDGTTWTQVNLDGFRPANNKVVAPAIEFGPPGATYLYTGTFSGIGGEIWRSPDGTTWTAVTTDFGADNLVVIPMAILGGNLYAGTLNYMTGGEIWRSSDGLTWTSFMTGGFGLPGVPNPDNEWIFSLTAFGGNLYAGTENEVTGAEVWRWDGTIWTKVLSTATTGFTPDNTRIVSLVEFGTYLYAGTDNWMTGAEVWRSSDGLTWERVTMPAGFTAHNMEISSLAVFGTYLYAGTENWVTGGEIWRSVDGLTWAPVMTGGFGDVNNNEISSLAVFDLHLFAGTDNRMTGAEVWKSPDGGATWTQANLDGFGDGNNEAAISLAIFGGNLYAGTINRSTGGEIWRTAEALAPVLSVTPMSLDFGNVTIGQPEDLSFTVTNTGGGTLTGSATVPAGPFSIVGASDFSLVAGASASITVRFSPTAAGSFSETVSFTSNGGDLTRGVSGTGVLPGVPVLSVTPDPSLDFGSVIVTQSRDLDFTVTNTGGGTLTGSATVAAPFSIIGESSFSLGAGLNTTVTVRFSPTATGSFSETVAFTSNGGDLNRSVFGTGVPTADP